MTLSTFLLGFSLVALFDIVGRLLRSESKLRDEMPAICVFILTMALSWLSRGEIVLQALASVSFLLGGYLVSRTLKTRGSGRPNSGD